jgi:serine/threonine-protein kinase HipA
MREIEVSILKEKVGELFYNSKSKEYGFNYTKEKASTISLTMPYRKETYKSSFYLHPIFEMNLPEGYLFEIFKNFLSKEHGFMDDFLVLSYLAPNIENRLRFKSEFDKKLFESVDIDDILNNDSEDTFLKLLKNFLNKNAISGVQPKTLAIVKEKETLVLKEYIVKTWGDEYPFLAQNEYYSMKAVERAGVKIPNIQLSKNSKFLLVEKFNYQKEEDEYFGFEEILVLQGKNREKKYSGSYEQVAKIIYAVSTDKLKSMQQFYKTVVMNYLLKNGDAHLKNFGVLYDNQFKNIQFAPAYDIVNTVAYIYQDKPALMMFGKKVWWGKEELVRFGIEHCLFSKTEAQTLYAQCFKALKTSIKELKSVIKKDKEFATIGQKMLLSWELSLDEKTYKEIPLETI